MAKVKINDIVKYPYGTNPNQLYIVKHQTDHWVRIVQIDDATESKWVSYDSCVFVGVASSDFKYAGKAPEVARCPVVYDTPKEKPIEKPPVRTGAPNKKLSV